MMFLWSPQWLPTMAFRVVNHAQQKTVRRAATSNDDDNRPPPRRVQVCHFKDCKQKGGGPRLLKSIQAVRVDYFEA
jgi:hypothetical protein